MVPDQASMEAGEFSKKMITMRVVVLISDLTSVASVGMMSPSPGIVWRGDDLLYLWQLSSAQVWLQYVAKTEQNKNYLWIIFATLFSLQDSQMVGVGSSSSNNQAVLQQRQMEDKMVTHAHTCSYMLILANTC